MVATPGWLPVFRFALAQAKSRNVELDVLFVRHIAVPILGPTSPDAGVDPAARRFFDSVRQEAEVAGVTVHSSYLVARNVARAIADFAVERGVDVLILPSRRRGPIWRAVKGDVVRNVARRLPERIRLLVPP